MLLSPLVAVRPIPIITAAATAAVAAATVAAAVAIPTTLTVSGGFGLVCVGVQGENVFRVKVHPTRYLEGEEGWYAIREGR